MEIIGEATSFSANRTRTGSAWL